MKLVKIALGVVVALVVLVVILLVIGLNSLDAIAKTAVEKGGSYALGVDTTLDTADVGLMAGTFSMAGLTVANPPGYDSPHFFRLDSAGVALDTGTVMADPVVIDVIEMAQIDVHLDKKDGKANYAVIMDNLKRFESGEDTGQPEPTAGESKKVSVGRVTIDGVRVHVNLVPELGEATKLDVNVPKVELTNIGSDGADPVEVAELVAIIVKAVMQAVVDASGGVLPASIVSDLENQLAQLEDLESLGVELAAQIDGEMQKIVTDVQQQAEDAARDLQDRAEDAVDDAAKDLQDRLPGGLPNPFGGGRGGVGDGDAGGNGEGGGGGEAEGGG